MASRRADNLPRRFAKIYTAAITDVLDEMGLLRQTLPHVIQPLTPDMRLAGYASGLLDGPGDGWPMSGRDWVLPRRIGRCSWPIRPIRCRWRRWPGRPGWW